mmetsp:Transcript_32613/g.62365  ORF Transcript_32613/g.62365 Transcript_32613/m.62365 type:complete len:94 (-) Transcript_32613:1237-1518(-)
MSPASCMQHARDILIIKSWLAATVSRKENLAQLNLAHLVCDGSHSHHHCAHWTERQHNIIIIIIVSLSVESQHTTKKKLHGNKNGLTTPNRRN